MAAQTHSVNLPAELDGTGTAAGSIRRGLAVYVLIDALGWPLVRSHGFLNSELPFRKPLRTTLGYSSGAIPTILTGRPPSEHGRWNLLYHDPQGSPFAWLRRCGAWANRFDNRYGRAVLTRFGRHALGLGPGFECVVAPRLLPFFNWAERCHLYAPHSIETTPTAFDVWQRAGLRFRIFSYRSGGDEALLERACHAIANERLDAVFVYLCELDHFLHMHRQQPAEIQPMLAHYAQAVGALYRAARRRDPEASFRVFSDHGMAPVHTRVDLAGRLRELPWRMPEDYLAVYDSTMVRLWFFRPEARRAIEELLRGQTCGRLLEPEELRRHGVWFADGRYGQRIFLLDAGAIVAEGEFNGRGWNPSGMHGYHPDDVDSDAVLLSNRPADLGAGEIRDLFTCLIEPATAI